MACAAHAHDVTCCMRGVAWLQLDVLGHERFPTLSTPYVWLAPGDEPALLRCMDASISSFTSAHTSTYKVYGQGEVDNAAAYNRDSILHVFNYPAQQEATFFSVLPPRLETSGVSLLELGVRTATAAEDTRQRYTVRGHRATTPAALRCAAYLHACA